MDRYIEFYKHILELPILLAIIVLLLVGIATLLIFLYSFSLNKPNFKRILFSLGGFALLTLILGVGYYNGVIELDDIPIFSTDINEESTSNNPQRSSSKNQSLKYRYSLSHILDKLGFIGEIHDDGDRTYIHLNTLVVPSVFIEDASGDLIDQKDHLTIKTDSDHPFPVLVADKLSVVWYLQFDSLVLHIKQNPVFKPSFDTGSVEVFYSDRLFATLNIAKDSYICDQASPQIGNPSTPYSRYYFVFDEMRYYLNDCSMDFSSMLHPEKQEQVVLDPD